ncbi:hypothetical protein [Luteolibacter marinus]|uniref:hypothetical protein n=1 Tax=Luteolibacter marinus TaxID=2776705 RepID=UPI001865FE7B|nr:hypothetical protein [Luteolibacter marinus]
MRILFLLALAAATTALANDTSINSGAHGPSPLGEFAAEESVVRMVSETIAIRFGKEESEVTCRFTFRSTKQGGAANQTVGFPDLLEMDSDTGRIRKLETFVDGKPVEAKKVRGWFATGDWGTPKSGFGAPPPELPAGEVQLADFFAIEVAFPPDRDVIIERHYLADNGGDTMGTSWFSYTTHTGAVWQGTIGKAEFRVKLDGWTVDDLAFEDGPQKLDPRKQSGWCSPNLAEWTVVSPTELTMTWKDFEPAVHKTRRGIEICTWSQQMLKAGAPR